MRHTSNIFSRLPAPDGDEAGPRIGPDGRKGTETDPLRRAHCGEESGQESEGEHSGS